MNVIGSMAIKNIGFKIYTSFNPVLTWGNYLTLLSLSILSCTVAIIPVFFSVTPGRYKDQMPLCVS